VPDAAPDRADPIDVGTLGTAPTPSARQVGSGDGPDPPVLVHDCTAAVLSVAERARYGLEEVLPARE
jgi:hypothetical protein